MIKYFFSFSKEKHCVSVKIEIPVSGQTYYNLSLPAWRPGRYQLQNFAKNIFGFSATDEKGNSLIWKKAGRNDWQIETRKSKKLRVSYNYYALEFNAGGSVVNQNLIYINPVNLTMYPTEKKLKHDFEVNLAFEEKGALAIGLPYEQNDNQYRFYLDSYYRWFDSPFVFSDELFHHNFSYSDTSFHFWMHGSSDIFLPQLLSDLEIITEAQIRFFSGFPEKQYHFILMVPENTYYHGVEHACSTIMVLGEKGVLPQSYYYDFLSLASHELFHAWNIAKIRPSELLSYDYSKENYFETCFVAEGFTTYYGDNLLFRSGVINEEIYLKELETTLKRHFDEADNAAQSLLESSFDLWVDGYEKGIPGKKVSVYNKGAVAALILDLKIRKKHNNSKSLDDIMLKLWSEFGSMQKGYQYLDIIRISEAVYDGPLKDYFDLVIAGNDPIFDYTNHNLSYLGLQMHVNSFNGLISLKSIKERKISDIYLS
jgi:predicted metalloprotease with PDZ domain